MAKKRPKKPRPRLPPGMAGAVWDQLMALRAVTKMARGLHEAQVYQLKVWPRVLFQDSVRSEVAVRFGDPSLIGDPSTAEFTIYCKSGREKAILTDEEATALLQTYVHQMLGDEWVVEISVVRK